MASTPIPYTPGVSPSTPATTTAGTENPLPYTPGVIAGAAGISGSEFGDTPLPYTHGVVPPTIPITAPQSAPAPFTPGVVTSIGGTSGVEFGDVPAPYVPGVVPMSGDSCECEEDNNPIPYSPASGGGGSTLTYAQLQQLMNQAPYYANDTYAKAAGLVVGNIYRLSQDNDLGMKYGTFVTVE